MSDDQRKNDDVVICRCEEVTRAEIERAIAEGCLDLDAIKRATRAGMGMCQSKTCAKLVTDLIARAAGISPGDVEPFTARSPLRPISAQALADFDRE